MRRSRGLSVVCVIEGSVQSPESRVQSRVQTADARERREKREARGTTRDEIID